MFSKAIRSCCLCEACAAGDGDAVVGAGAVDNQKISVRVIAAHNSDMAVIGVEYQITRLGFAPRDVRAIAVLRGCAAASAGEVFAACRVIECPVHKAAAIQAQRTHRAGHAAACGCDLRRRTPTVIPSDYLPFPRIDAACSSSWYSYAVPYPSAFQYIRMRVLLILKT